MKTSAWKPPYPVSARKGSPAVIWDGTKAVPKQDMKYAGDTPIMEAPHKILYTKMDQLWNLVNTILNTKSVDDGALDA